MPGHVWGAGWPARPRAKLNGGDEHAAERGLPEHVGDDGEAGFANDPVGGKGCCHRPRPAASSIAEVGK